MPRVLNDTKRDHVLPDGFRIGPGEHEVPAATWEAALRSDSVREWVRSGALQDVTLPVEHPSPVVVSPPHPAAELSNKGAKAKAR